jgi:hypothetical protein
MTETAATWYRNFGGANFNLLCHADRVRPDSKDASVATAHFTRIFDEVFQCAEVCGYS